MTERMKGEFTVTTQPFENGRIISHVTDPYRHTMQTVIDTLDNQTRQALIGLGWTPPNGLAALEKYHEVLRAEVEAWRLRFPQHEYRPADECVSLKLDTKEAKK